MNNIPRLSAWSSAWGLAHEGFAFIYNRCRRLQSDLFEINVPFLKVVCISGPEAAQLFYDPQRFIRRKAVPKRIQKTLFGEKAVQVLDNGAHLRRKEIFMSIMSPDQIQRLSALVSEHFQKAIPKWETMDRTAPGSVRLFDQMQELLCRVACAWAGVPLAETEVPKRTRLLWQMVDAFGAVGPRHLQGRWARRRTEAWIRNVILDVREGRLHAPAGTAAHAMAWSPDVQEQPMDAQVAAVELINIIRPIVAISTYVVFAALALHDHPEYREKLRTATEEDIEQFVHEVRRYYPFAPFLGANVRTAFDWRGCHFPEGAMVLLDIYGTNRDPNTWDRPLEFLPERFRDRAENAYDFIPQGGGNYHTNHRCAGEWVTIETIKVALTYLTRHLIYSVPPQDLTYKLSRMPTYPKSRFVISQIKGL